jgi:TolB protein
MAIAIAAVATLGACGDDPVAPRTSSGALPSDASLSGAPSVKAGGKIALIVQFGLDKFLYLMNADGSELTRVSSASYAYEADPAWFPDYKSVLYIDYYATNALKRYTLANGRVETIYSAPGSVVHPEISPDGKQIAFDMQGSDGNRDIYVVNVDGTNLRRLTSDAGVDEHPTWSPDGQRIAFTSQQFSAESMLYVMSSDGSNQSFLQNCGYGGTSGNCLSPVWSPVPGDERIAFAVDAPGYESLRVIDADGGNGKVVIADATVADKQPSWSRDATKLAFRSKIAGTAYPDIYSINTNGTGLRQLTPRFDSMSPAWAR